MIQKSNSNSKQQKAEAATMTAIEMASRVGNGNRQLQLLTTEERGTILSVITAI